MAGKVRITEDLLDLQTESDIKIIPIVHGEIIPFILAGAAFGGAAIAASVAAPLVGAYTFLGLSAATYTALGTVFLLQGVSDLLFPPPTPPTFKTDEQDPSFVFNGMTNISKQGVPINIVYGETLIGTNTVSANIDTLQVVNQS